MERLLFSPCTRLHDILESQSLLEEVVEHHPDPLQELTLNVSTIELLSAERGFTFADLYAMLGNQNTIAWLTPHAAVTREGGRAMRYWNQLDGLCSFSFSADGKNVYAFARSLEHLLEICDAILRLLAVSVFHSVHLFNWPSSNGSLFTNAPTLEYLMEQCQSQKFLSLFALEMDEDNIRVLGDYSRPDLEIELDSCKIMDAGAGALAKVLGRNQGPTRLDLCRIDYSVIANGLQGNSRLKSLRPRFSYIPEVRDREVLAYTRALQPRYRLLLQYAWSER
jgi:hypothetical protein